MKKPLTIGVDIRDLKKAKTGIKTYLEELCREFKTMNSDELHFYFLDTNLPIYTGPNKLLKWTEHFRYQLWKQLVLPIKAWSKKCDIVFCVDNCVPYIHLNYITIHAIHDAFCYESPEHYGKLWLWLYKTTAAPGARRSPRVITATSYGKKQVAHFMKLDPDKLIVVHDGPKRMNYNTKVEKAVDNITDLFPVSPKNYILHVGAMYKRKNLVALVNAFARIKKDRYPDLKLVLAGSLSTNKFDNDYDLILERIEKHGLKDDVIITGYLTDPQVGQLYENALLYVFPSLNEGFGLPVLEAFEHDVPTLVSNNTCLPEVGGDAVIAFDPYNEKDMADKIQMVLSSAELRSDMIKKGRERLKKFSWQATAQQIVDVFKVASLKH
nr:glycosyltransferase family 1 protein [uncultured Mucilaginibacter sp.]